MKKLILIALAFVTLQVVAQDKRKRDLNDDSSKREMMKDLSPDEMATLGSKKMTLALDLSQQQQNQVKTVLLKQATKRKQMMEDREKKMKNEDAKQPSKEERVKLMNARLDDKIAMKQEMKSILTAEQYVKWEEMQAKRDKQKKDKHKRKEKH